MSGLARGRPCVRAGRSRLRPHAGAPGCGSTSCGAAPLPAGFLADRRLRCPPRSSTISSRLVLIFGGVAYVRSHAGSSRTWRGLPVGGAQRRASRQGRSVACSARRHRLTLTLGVAGFFRTVKRVRIVRARASTARDGWDSRLRRHVTLAPRRPDLTQWPGAAVAGGLALFVGVHLSCEAAAHENAKLLTQMRSSS
jgi:hypothetical protein